MISAVAAPVSLRLQTNKSEETAIKIMKNNPLKQLETFGQSIWLDYIRRDLITSGGLRRMIEGDGLRGMTSNPSIFEKAIADSHDYDGDIRAMALIHEGVESIYESLSQHDVRSAADEFRSLYDRTDGKTGGNRPSTRIAIPDSCRSPRCASRTASGCG